jgi:signal peptide peptidase SppA
MFLPHLASRFYGTPLLLARTKLDIILSVLGSRIGWSETPILKSPALSAVPFAPNLQTNANGIAVIGVHGSLVRRNLGVDAQSGLMSYAEIGQSLESAAADPSVSGILLDIDSPGGEAGGVFELAQRIREVDAIKPVWALASDCAFSAAYALACAASRVLITQTGGVGSIGVIAMHVDQSVRDAQQGYRFTPVTAGDCKNDLSPHEPLNKDSNARLQAEVDRLYGLFVDHVAAMRDISPKVIRATEAACYFGADAINVGLADALVRSDQVIDEFAAYLSQSRVVRNASRVIGVSQQAFAQTSAESIAAPAPPAPPLSFTTPKEISMIQDEPPTPYSNPSTDAPETLPAPHDEDGQVQDSQPSHTSESIVGDPVRSDATAVTNTARADALVIAELCQLAGQSDRIVGFLSQGISPHQVRQVLLQQRAQSEEISSLIHPDAAVKSIATHAAGTSALMAAVKKLASPQSC